jgi:alginate production protein
VVDGGDVPSQLATVGVLTEFDTFLAYAEVLGEHQHSFPKNLSSDNETEAGSARGGQAYFRLAHFPGPGLSLVVGRQKFFETRRWYYDNRNLDAVRIFGEHGRVAFQVSVSRDLFDKTRNQRDQDATNRIAEVRWDLRRDLALQAFYLNREDRTELRNSPEILGLRVLGDPGTHLEFWADLAHEGGTRGLLDSSTGAIMVRTVQAHALDIGLTYRPRVVLDPSFTASFALGSGDDQLTLPAGQLPHGADGTFHQSGLQRNRTSLNGVVSFRYYGEVLNPELTNLRIQTLGAGLRPFRPLSLDFLFHLYRQDVPSSRLENTDLDAKPSGLDPHLGSEWDVVVGYEPRREFELRLTGGYFQPGKAFPADATPSTIATVQARFRF